MCWGMLGSVTDSHEISERNLRRRAVLDGITKAIDVTVGAVAIVAGIYALVATPPSIIREVSLPFLVVFWGYALILGGAAALLGRLTEIWLLETSGIAATATGTLIYLAVVSTAIANELGVVVAVALILIALLSLARRYVELQKFLAEPEHPGVLGKISNLIRLRTSR